MLLRRFGETESNTTVGWQWDSGFTLLSVYGLNSSGPFFYKSHVTVNIIDCLGH